MMNISEIKKELFDSKIQLIQLSYDGVVIESEDTIFNANVDAKLATYHPFFEAIESLLITVDSKLHFPCVNMELDTKTIIADIDIINEDNTLFMAIFDFTDHYAQSHPLVQEKNEVSIAKNRLSFEKELLLAKEEFKNSFLAQLNHEIRNPLNNLLGFMEILGNSKLTYEQKETLHIMQKTGMHLKVLMDDLLDISKIEKGIIETKNVPFNLGHILTNLFKHFQIKYGKTDVELQHELNKKVPVKLIGDPTRLNQILFNLLENAYKHTVSGNISVLIDLKQQVNKVAKICFTISDTGKGISEKNLPHIFDSYYQIEMNKAKPLGEGLGLKIVKEITQLIGGDIEVESIEHKGATFRVTLPFEVRVKDTSPKSIPKGSGIVMSKRILIAENEEINQMLLMKTFLNNNEGFYVEIAKDGKQVIKLIEKKKYDMLLLKMKLPDMSGFEILTHIRSQSNSQIKDLPILVVSGSTLKEEQELILLSGASGFLGKPYTKKELIKKINALLSK